MSYFWNHKGDLSRPPSAKDLKCRRPWSKAYWESTAFHRVDSLIHFLERWAQETGNPVPELPPRFSGHSSAGYYRGRGA